MTEAGFGSFVSSGGALQPHQRQVRPGSHGRIVCSCERTIVRCGCVQNDVILQVVTRGCAACAAVTLQRDECDGIGEDYAAPTE